MCIASETRFVFNGLVCSTYLEIKQFVGIFYVAFESFDFERIWWRLFQKRAIHTKFDIYVFIMK